MRPGYAYACANPNMTRPCSTIDTVDRTMADIQEQTQLASEVSEAISSSTYAGVEIDEVRVPPSYYAPCAPGRAADALYVSLPRRTRSSRSSPTWSRMSSTTGSWATTCPCTIQQGRAESKTVRYHSCLLFRFMRADVRRPACSGGRRGCAAQGAAGCTGHVVAVTHIHTSLGLDHPIFLSSARSARLMTCVTL